MALVVAVAVAVLVDCTSGRTMILLAVVSSFFVLLLRLVLRGFCNEIKLLVEYFVPFVP